jgi:hypothetical protein
MVNGDVRERRVGRGSHSPVTTTFLRDMTKQTIEWVGCRRQYRDFDIRAVAVAGDGCGMQSQVRKRPDVTKA